MLYCIYEKIAFSEQEAEKIQIENKSYNYVSYDNKSVRCCLCKQRLNWFTSKCKKWALKEKKKTAYNISF